METRGMSVLWKKSSLFLVSLCLFGAVAAQAAECRNQIEVLGRSTAIMRGGDVETVADLQKIIVKKKYREAFRQILERAQLGDRFDEVMEKIVGLNQEDLHTYDQGTEFDWMAFRHKSDKRVDLLRNSCWEGRAPFKAWLFTLDMPGGPPRAFVIPATCLNLALLKDKPPTCELTATAKCSEKPASITITATVQAQGKSTIQDVKLTEKPLLPDGQKNPNAWEWTFENVPSDSYKFTAVVTDDKKLRSRECTTTVVVCVKTPEPYKPPKSCEQPASCQLKASGTWQSDKGTLTISAEGTVAQSADLTITPPGGAPEKLTHFKEPISKSEPEGEYTIKLVAQSGDALCKPAECTTTVALKPPPPPCCDSPWLLRAYGAFAQAEGSEEHGTLQSTYLGTGTYKFHFNQGVGFGFELERLFKNGNLGWTFGLFQADLDTLWVSDSYSPTSSPGEHWIFDHDRTPLRTLTTGLNFHVHHPAWDFFAGPVIGYATIGDITYADGSAHPGTTRASFDDSFVYGVNVGFDVMRGKCWGFTGGAEYLKIPAKAGILDVDVDPLILRVGVVYHF